MMENTPGRKMSKTACPKCGSPDTQSFEMANRSGNKKPELAEPKKDGGALESGVLMFIVLAAFNLPAVAVMVAGNALGFDIVTVGVVGVIFGLIVAVTVGLAVVRRMRKLKPKREAAYTAAMSKWQASWLCLRCGKTFFVRT